MKRLMTTAMALLLAIAAFAQTGGVKGTVVDRQGRKPVQGAALTLSRGGQTLAEGVTDKEGAFLIEDLADGMYDDSGTGHNRSGRLQLHGVRHGRLGLHRHPYHPLRSQ